MSNAIEKIGAFDKFGSVLGLERIRELLRRLGNPQEELKIIHVAGTNGKGSTCRFMYQALREAGYKVGIYSSPYLEVFNERIEFDGKYIPDEYLDKYADRASQIAKEMCDEGLLSPTEFDVVTAIGFLYFAEMKADFVLLEVGLGGIGDSTNVVDKPVITAITSISMDHTDRLGETIEEIAREKAGIIKNGAPVVSGVTDERAKAVIKARADELGAEFIDTSLTAVEICTENLNGTVVNCEVLGKEYCDLKVSLVGRHQVRNAMVALMSLEVLSKSDIISLTSEDIKKGFDKTTNPGRFEVFGENPMYILDGAHNEDGVKNFVNTVKCDLKNKKLLLVAGVLKDKDVDTMFKTLGALEADFVATEPDNPRKMDKEDLADLMKVKGLNVVEALTPEGAVRYAQARGGEYDAILFVGSLYLIGMVRRLLNVS